MMDDLTEIIETILYIPSDYSLSYNKAAQSKKPKYRQTGNILTGTILQALVAEIGLKMLYEIENPQQLAKGSHNLLKLFELLSRDTQDKLNGIYIAKVHSFIGSPLNISVDVSAPGLKNVREVFASQDNMFVLWRYYAEGKAGPGFSEHLARANLAVRILVEEAEATPEAEDQ